MPNQEKIEDLRKRSRSRKKSQGKTIRKEAKKEDASKQFLPEMEIDIETLPSRGVPYPKGSKLSYKTYSFGEVKKASVSNMGMVPSLKLAISGVTADGFDPRQLTVIDALYIGLLRKVSSMGGLEFEIPYACHACGSPSKARFSHSDITFRDLSDEVTELPITAEIAGVDYKFTCMTVKQFLELHSGRYDKVFKEGKIDRVAVYASMITNVPFAQAYDALYDNRDPLDIEVLNEIDKLLVHDIKALKTTCKAESTEEGNSKTCDTVNLVKLEGREALLLPFRKGEKTARNRIRLGSTSESECVSD